MFVQCMQFLGFYQYMNNKYADGWILVGGAACWAYFTDARKIDRDSATIYNTIFPDDIDVIVAGDVLDKIVYVYADGKHIEVDFVNDMIDRGERCKSAVTLGNGARVLPIKQIIQKYNMTSEKRQLRQTRIKFLENLSNGNFDAQALQSTYSSTSNEPTNPFAGAFAKLGSRK